MPGNLKEIDQEMISVLIKANIPKNVAKVLVYLASAGEVTSMEIEHSAFLRQPEVSIAIQELRKRNWVTKRDLKKEGKGRPVHYYRLAIPFSQIIESIEAQENERVEKIHENLKKMKELMVNYK